MIRDNLRNSVNTQNSWVKRMANFSTRKNKHYDVNDFSAMAKGCYNSDTNWNTTEPWDTRFLVPAQKRLLFTPKVPILQVVLLFRMQLWPVAHFFHSLLGGFAVVFHPPKSKWKKWATGQSCIRKRSTTCKIGTLSMY